MSFELDHFFVFTNLGAPEIEDVLAFGLIEGGSRIHTNQGTANRCIFFHNAMLEFIWVCHEQETHQPLIQRLQIGERSQYRLTGFSPFGIALRPASNDEQSSSFLPFQTWGYYPVYLQNPLHLKIASHTRSIEPMIFGMSPLGMRPDTLPPERSVPMNHPQNLREITRISLTLPSVAPLSVAAQALQDSEFFSFISGEEHLADIEFDYKVQGKTIDFSPRLPLRFWY